MSLDIKKQQQFFFIFFYDRLSNWVGQKVPWLALLPHMEMCRNLSRAMGPKVFFLIKQEPHLISPV